MIKKSFIVTFIIMILLPTIAWDKKAKLTITEPKNSKTITERMITVKGISEGLKPDSVIYIYVKTNKNYLQGDTIIRSDGSWMFYPAVIGTVDGKNFYAEVFARTESGVISNIVKIYRAK
ncbi:MAG: hypothetical protein GY940_02350 [bacterium]|nr:hypothetical protein [bacterium]